MTLAEATALADSPKNLSLSSQKTRSVSTERSANTARGDLRLERHDAMAARAALGALAVWCEQFSPSVGVEETDRPESLLLDVTGLGHLFQGEENLCAQLAQAFAGRGLHIRWALADTIGAAWALAHYAHHAPGAAANGSAAAHPATHSITGENCGVLAPPGEGAQAVAQLPMAALRLGAEPARLLGELGLMQIGQLQAIPRSALAARFEPELLRRWDQLTGAADEVIRAEELPAELQVVWSSEQPVTRSDVIEAVIEQLLAQVAAALAAQGRGVVRLTCRLRGLGGAQSLSGQFMLSLFRPSATAEHLFELARLQFERLRLAEPVTEIVVSVTGSEQLECRQGELFATVGGREDRRQLATLVDRLANRLGRERVLRARIAHDAQPELACRYEPLTGDSARRGPRAQNRPLKERPIKTPRRESRKQEPAWPGAKRPARKDTRSTEDERGGRGFWWSQRPLRLAPQPAPLQVIALAPAGPPLRFCLAGENHVIARSWGPERIETGWWRGRPVRRDYYRVETETGVRHWLFRRLTDGHWFWHGEFD